MVSFYSRFGIGGGEYRRLIHPSRFPVDIEWYRKDWCVFIIWVCPIELVRDEPAVYMSAELFCFEGVLLPFVKMIKCVVEEAFMVDNCCDVEWRGCGMLGCWGRLCG